MLQCYLNSVKMHNGHRQCQLHFVMPQNEFNLMGLAYMTMPAASAQVTAMTLQNHWQAFCFPFQHPSLNIDNLLKFEHLCQPD